MKKSLFLLVTFYFCLAQVSCAGPKPVLYPNQHYNDVGNERAEQDIADCRKLAKKAGAGQRNKAGEAATSTAMGAGIGAAAGAASGAIISSAASGSAIGAVSGAIWSLLTWAFRPSPPSQAHVNYVNRCLQERGYEPVGWE